MEIKDIIRFMYAQGYYPNWDNGLILRAKTIDQLYLEYLIFTETEPLCLFPRWKLKKILKSLGYFHISYSNGFYVYTK